MLVGGTGGDDNGSFTIAGNTLRTAAVFSYATKSSYSIRVRTTDAGGLYFGRVFTITVTPANRAPTDIALSSSSVAENQPSGTAVGTLSTTDPDAGNTFTYSLVSGSGSTDNGSFTINGTQVQTAASFNYEAKNSYSIRVRTTDQGGLYTEKTFTITVTDVDEIAPTVTAVYVRGSTWSSGYLTFLAANLTGSSSTYGYAIPVGSGSTQLQTLPWRNLNQISLAFSEDVSVAQAQLAIVASVGSYSVSGFSYNATDHVATWSLSAAIGPDKLYVAVPGSGSAPVTDLAGNVLDGEWNNPSSYSQVGSTDTFPSGDGTAGGDFAFRFDVLPGDSTGGSLGKVNVADVAQTKSRSTLAVSNSSYRSDFDGNNLINVADVAYVKSKSSIYSLPVDPPVLPVFGSVMPAANAFGSYRRAGAAGVWRRSTLGQSATKLGTITATIFSDIASPAVIVDECTAGREERSVPDARNPPAYAGRLVKYVRCACRDGYLASSICAENSGPAIAPALRVRKRRLLAPVCRGQERGVASTFFQPAPSRFAS